MLPDRNRNGVSKRESGVRQTAPTIESDARDETTSVGRVADEVDDGLVGPQRAPAPVDRDEREQTMLHPVPLAGAGPKVADMDRHVELVSDALQLMLPHVRPVAVAAPCVRGDEYLARLGAALGANSTPPGLDGPHRKDRRVLVDANADEAFVGGQVIGAVWDRFADREIDFMTVPRSRPGWREARPVARTSRASHPPSQRWHC